MIIIDRRRIEKGQLLAAAVSLPSFVGLPVAPLDDAAVAEVPEEQTVEIANPSRIDLLDDGGGAVVSFFADVVELLADEAGGLELAVSLFSGRASLSLFIARKQRYAAFECTLVPDPGRVTRGARR